MSRLRLDDLNMLERQVFAAYNTSRYEDIGQYVHANGNEKCSICLAKMQSRVIRLACSHTFHSHCIDAWLDRHSSCPMCRRCVVINEINHDE